MTPERWARIEEVFGGALERSAEERAAYLEKACAGDEQLRRDVDRLLAEEQKASFKSPVAAATAPHLAAGTLLGRYRVEAKLGQGGMGVVYKGHDTLLDRPVALKILPGWQLADPVSRERLMREARAASALNHPNFITVFDVGCEGGVDFIAMEYVAGTALNALIGGRGLPLQETVRYATEIADALAAAHAAGVIHRDIKPANILVTPAGHVKVLDFGIAKTLWATATAAGVVVGTAQYMSPEQAEGRPADARSDIYSFGAVLYEMVTGRLASSRAPRKPASPEDLERIIAKCLRDDPARRFQHMDDVKVALQDIGAEPRSVRSRGKLLATAVAVAILAALAAVSGWLTRRPAPEGLPILSQLTKDTGLTYQPAISPDGSLIAYASDRGGENLDIWVQHVTRGEPIRLTSNDATDYEPSFSPDGGTIVFVSDVEGGHHHGGGIYLVPSLGGAARRIAGPPGRRPRFSPDGQWVAYWAGDAHSSGRLYIVAPEGGTPREIAAGWVEAPFLTGRSPVWTPDGKHLVFRSFKNREHEWWVADIDGGAPVSTGALEACRRANLTFADTGPGSIWPEQWIAGTNEILFSARSGDSINLWKIAISPTTWKVIGEPQRLTVGPGLDLQGSSSTAGRIVFSNMSRNLDIWSLAVDPGTGTASGEPKQLTHGAARDHSPSVSRDGRRMVFESDRTGKQVVWTKDLVTGKETRLTDTPSLANLPRISPDGTQVAYMMNSRGARGYAPGAIYVVPFSGGTPRMVAESYQVLGWMPDSRTILCESRSQPTIRQAFFDTATGRQRVLAQPAGLEIERGGLSPDGRWIAFGVRGREGWFIAPVWDTVAPPEQEWIPARGDHWSNNADRMLVISGEDGFRCIWTQRLDPKTKRMIGEPQPVYHFHSARRSLANVSFYPGLSVAADKLVFTQGELTGNIWMAEWSKHK